MSESPLSFLSLDAPPTLSEQAYLRLREAIVAGTLAGGAKISERTLAAALGISPQPVREALRRLEAEGMVESRARSGTFVALLTIERVVEMGRVRAVLEGVAAASAARHAAAADVVALRARLEAVRRLTSAGDPAALAEANDALHNTLHAITGNAWLIRSLQSLLAYFHFGSRRVLGSEGENAQAFAEHAAIVEAVAAHDPDRAERLMRDHAMRSLRVAFPEAGD